MLHQEGTEVELSLCFTIIYLVWLTPDVRVSAGVLQSAIVSLAQVGPVLLVHTILIRVPARQTIVQQIHKVLSSFLMAEQQIRAFDISVNVAIAVYVLQYVQL